MSRGPKNVTSTTETEPPAFLLGPLTPTAPGGGLPGFGGSPFTSLQTFNQQRPDKFSQLPTELAQPTQTPTDGLAGGNLVTGPDGEVGISLQSSASPQPGGLLGPVGMSNPIPNNPIQNFGGNFGFNNPIQNFGGNFGFNIPGQNPNNFRRGFR